MLEGGRVFLPGVSVYPRATVAAAPVLPLSQQRQQGTSHSSRALVGDLLALLPHQVDLGRDPLCIIHYCGQSEVRTVGLWSH